MIRTKRYDELVQMKEELIKKVMSVNPSIPCNQIQVAYSIITHEMQSEGKSIADFLRVIHRQLKAIRGRMKEECDMTEHTPVIKDINNIISSFETHDEHCKNATNDTSA